MKTQQRDQPLKYQVTHDKATTGNEPPDVLDWCASGRQETRVCDLESFEALLDSPTASLRSISWPGVQEGEQLSLDTVALGRVAP